MTNKRTSRKLRVKKKKQETPIVPVNPGELFNREMSWLEFNRRVLGEALDLRNPILERVRFLTIFTSNLDEFFMTRVGGLKQKINAGFRGLSADGQYPDQQLEAIRAKADRLNQEQSDCYLSSLRPSLEQSGIFLLRWNDLSPEEKSETEKYYRSTVFPILTPQAVDPGHPFPTISNLSVSLGVMLKHSDHDEQFFARVKIPTVLPQLFRLSSLRAPDQFRFVSLQTVIENNLESLFPGMQVQIVMPFRVTRSTQIDIDEYEVDDIVEVMEEELHERRFARAVRLEHGPFADPAMLKLILGELELTESDVYESVVGFDYLALKEISDLSVSALRAEPWTPVVAPAFADEDANIFGIIRAGDVFVHHPYESFNTSVERFLRAAVDDPNVLAIKITLYRVGDRSALIPLLIRAAENEKHVVCLVEVKANFDEARNIHLAQMMEEAGVHVMYGVLGLKTHAKVILVVRKEHDGVRCYSHIGTGNYNSQTSRFYTDVGLFTANKEICDDLVEFFHSLTGRSLQRQYKRLLVAPHAMIDRFHKMIDREIQNHLDAKPARIVAKMNSLQDPSICKALEKAAVAGVPIDLIVRGICCFKPGSQTNVRVISVVGRLLEHSRIFYFQNGAQDPIDGEFFIGSADWMHRNLYKRIEVAVPILDRLGRERCWEIFQVMLADQRNAWDLANDGSYKQRVPASPQDQGCQFQLLRLCKERLARPADLQESVVGSEANLGVKEEEFTH